MSTTRKMMLLFIAVVVLIGALVAVTQLRGHHVSQDPKQLFYSSLSRNLAEKGVSCTVTKSESGTTQQLAVQLDLVSKANAHSLMTVKTGDSTVQTEELVLKSGNYLRYTKATTTAKNANGKSPDFSKVTNIWIKPDSNKSELFGLTALGGCTVPLTAVSTRDEGTLTATLEKGEAFKADFANTATAEIEGQPVRQYNVTIQPGPYVSFMKSVGNAYGLSDLKSLNIKDYDSKTVRKAIFSVNTKTGRLARIQFTDESRVVTFQDYGKVPQITAPKQTISNKEAAQLIGQ